MLSKFFSSLKPKEYSVQVMRDSTSQSAVRRIKRTRTSSSLRKIAALTLAFSFVGGGLASATAASAVTAQQAQANIIADSICPTNADESNAGSWSGGTNVFGTVGGKAQISMMGVTSNTKPDDSAFAGQQGTWNTDKAPSNGKYLTAYEKYGMMFPMYDVWVPSYSEKEVTVKQVDSSKGSYSTADGKLPTKGGTALKPGSSPLTTADIGSCMAVMPSVIMGISNAIAVIPKFVMGASIELYSAAFGSGISQEGSTLYPIGKAIDSFITAPGGLRDSLFIPFIMPLILIGAIWVGYVGIVKRAAMQALQSTGWMVLAIALGSVFLAQPTLISSFVDETVATVQRIGNDAVMQGSQTTEMCDLSKAPDDPNRTIRETKCTIWHSTIYSTWAAGQFGQAANSASANGSVLTQNAGRQVLGTTEYQIYYGSDNAKVAKTWPQFMVDRQVTNKSPELTEVAWAQLSGVGGASINNAWSGGEGMISSAVLMFFGAGAASAVLLVYGFALLIYQLMMVSAVLMSPFFFLFGIVPNWGRRVLMRYAELLTSLALKRIVTGLLLSFYLVFYNLIVGGADGNSDVIFLKVLLIFALALFFITSRTKFVKMFADNINFGGNKSVGLPGNKAVAVAAGIGAGLLGGGIIGAAVVGHKTRKENKDTEGNLKTTRIEGSPTADIKTPPRSPNATGASGGAIRTVGKVVNGAQNGKQAIDFAVDVKDGKNPLTRHMDSFVPDSLQPKGLQGDVSAPKTPNGPTTPSSAGTPAPGFTGAGKAGASGATPPVSMPAAGPQVAPAAAKGAGSFVNGGAAAAGTTVAPAAASGAATAAASGATAAGAAGSTAASGAAGIAASGAAAGGSAGVAAGGAAATGAIAGGAAAGSVVPVVGTVVGAAAAAAAVAAKQRKNDSDNNGGTSG